MFLISIYLFFFFFFQAEDGIRDRNVTGVQTCALPISGSPLAEAPGKLSDLPEAVPPALRADTTAVTATVLETLVERPEERVVLAGTANLARTGALDFPRTIRPVLEALEEQVILLRLFGEATDAQTVRVSIGEENPHEGLWAASVVSTGYGGERG